MNGWKVWTNDYRSPIQGGAAVWDGTYPYALPEVPLDASDAECAAGWNFAPSLADALRIAGFWPNGWPSLPTLVEAGADAITRGQKARASSLTILRAATATEITAAIEDLSRPFGPHASRMVLEQLAWRQALARPDRDAAAVEAGLRDALAARGLDWTLRRFSNARAARDSRAAWGARDARGARDAWDSWAAWAAWDSRAAWGARDAWDSRAAWDALDSRAAWGARDAWDSWAARDAWDSWAAWAALVVMYAGLMGWIEGAPEKLTVGLRDAYAHGLSIAMPTGPNELGWAMEEVAG